MVDLKNKEISPFLMVIFGGSGDLTLKKVIPSLFELYIRKLLPSSFYIVSIARSNYNTNSYRDKVKLSLQNSINNKIELLKQLSSSDIEPESKSSKDLTVDRRPIFKVKNIDEGRIEKDWINHAISEIKEEEPQSIDSFITKIDYLLGDPQDINTFEVLKNYLYEKAGQLNIAPNFLFYLATPPGLYKTILSNLSETNLNKEEKESYWRRIIIEKPFGRDLNTAIELENVLKSSFHEKQVFRIDHYLGKETIQNILVFRFSNGIFEPLWNRNYISYIEITAVEKDGVMSRGKYYDSSGALRDMVQNHLMQILGLIAMEPPVIFNQDMFRNEMDKVIESLRPIEKKDISKMVVRGQYIESDIKDIKAYRNEDYIPKDSRTETYVAMKLFVDNWRWNGVPFYIRTAKAMPTKATEIVIHFKNPPSQIFSQFDCRDITNKLIIRIQPDEGIVLNFGLKRPGEGFIVQPVTMDFKYNEMSNSDIFEAYAKLILNCIQGDAMLFSRSDFVLSSWKFINPILDAWQENQYIPLYGYPYGSWGPHEADDLMPSHKGWSNPCKNLTNTDSYCLL